MPLCSDILTSPFLVYKAQFEVDAPRISFYINDIACYFTQVSSILTAGNQQVGDTRTGVNDLVNRFAKNISGR